MNICRPSSSLFIVIASMLALSSPFKPDSFSFTFLTGYNNSAGVASLLPEEEHAFTLSTCRHMSRHFRRMASGGHFSEWRNLSVPRIYLLRNLKNDQLDGSAASLVKGFVFRSDFVSRHLRNPKVHSHHPAVSRADTSNSHRRQASEITESANQR